MTISRFGPLLAIVGAACLVSWTPEERAVKPTPRLALSEPNPSASPDPAASKPAASKPAPRGAESLESPSAVGAISAIAPASLAAPAASEKPVKVELAYADLEGAAPALGALSAVTPRAGTAALEPRAPAGAAALPPPARTPEAVILYNKGDAAGLLALASTATGADERSALEWASLRADGRPSFDSLAAFLEAHPDWPSRAWIRDRQEAELATHPQAPAEVAAFFARDPPQSTAGKIAAARAAQATGRPEEASQIIRSLWRDGNFDGPTEGVILRDFAISLTKADHAYRASRLIYAGYLSAGARTGPHRGGSRADESGAGQGGSASAPQRSRSPVLQNPVRPARRARLRGDGHAEPCASRSRCAHQPGSMVERAEDGGPRASRPRRAATCI